MKLLFLFLLPFTITAQQSLEQELDSALINAKKGVYWALTNLDLNKSRISIDLIDDNKLYAAVRIDREYRGVKIVSTGFYDSIELSVKLYRSDDYLQKEGYIKEEISPGEKEKK
jgi:hypothetical protein